MLDLEKKSTIASRFAGFCTFQKAILFRLLGLVSILNVYTFPNSSLHDQNSLISLR